MSAFAHVKLANYRRYPESEMAATMGHSARHDRPADKQYLSGPSASDPEPCLSCSKTAKCATGYACHRFVEWVRSGRDRVELSRVPMNENFARLYVESDPGVRVSGHVE
jgi:hypothetical protein